MCGDVRKTEGRHIPAVIVPISCPTVPGILNNKRIGRLPCEHTVSSSPHTDITRKGFKILHPCVSTLCLPDVTGRDDLPGVPPLHLHITSE